MTDRGWLFDLYPDEQGMRLWFLRETGGAVSLWEPYTPAFYVRGTRSAIDRALARIRRFRASAAPVERIDFRTGDPVPVIEVRVLDLRQYGRAVSVAGAEEGIELFTCDIPLPQRYAYDRGVFPLAYCSWDAKERRSIPATAGGAVWRRRSTAKPACSRGTTLPSSLRLSPESFARPTRT
ncbi:MAG: hypothetical protein HYR98_01700 [Nitrospirae bacterium]|nr:hypothetical protein [Nitrospirota bacterium]